MSQIIELVSVLLLNGDDKNPPPEVVAVFPLIVTCVRVASELETDTPPPKDAVLSVTVTFVNVTSELLIIIPPPLEGSTRQLFPLTVTSVTDATDVNIINPPPYFSTVFS